MTSVPESTSPCHPASPVHHALGAGVAFVAALLVFGRAMSFKFVLWDDDLNIHGNPHIMALTWENLRWMFTDFELAIRYKPLSWLTLALVKAKWGLEPRAYHVLGVVLHALNAALAYFALMKVARRGFGLATFTRRDAFLLAAATCLWAVHPLQAESVSWISAHHYPQATLFLLAALLFDPGIHRAETTSLWRFRLRTALALICFGVSLLTYPIGLEWPLILVMLDLATQRREGASAAYRWKHWFALRAPYFALSALFAVINLVGRFRIAAQWDAPASLETFSLRARLLQAAYMIVIYPLETILPWNLSPFYPRLHEVNAADPVLMIAAAVFVFITLALAALAMRWHWPLACWIAYCFLMFTKLGWTESPHYANDRYAYIPLLAFAVALFWCLRALRVSRGWFNGLIVVMVLIYGMAAFIQAGIWRDSETLLNTMSRRLGPHSFQAEILGRLGDVRRTRNQFEEALEAYTRALEASPQDARARYNRPMMLAKLGRVDEAISELQGVVESDSKNISAWLLLGQIYESRGEITKAKEMYSQAATIAPDNEIVLEAIKRVEAGTAP